VSSLSLVWDGEGARATAGDTENTSHISCNDFAEQTCMMCIETERQTRDTQSQKLQQRCVDVDVFEKETQTARVVITITTICHVCTHQRKLPLQLSKIQPCRFKGSLDKTHHKLGTDDDDVIKKTVTPLHFRLHSPSEQGCVVSLTSFPG
jgi:hypothetical protein